MAAALLLATLEVLVSGSIFLGFAIGALITSLVLLLPFDFSVTPTIALFATMSLFSWLVLRRYFRTPDDQTRVIYEDINK